MVELPYANCMVMGKHKGMASHDRQNEGMGPHGYWTTNCGGQGGKRDKKKKKAKKNKGNKDKEDKPNVVIEEESSDDDVSENEFQQATW
jgi:hypothetical protein